MEQSILPLPIRYCPCPPIPSRTPILFRFFLFKLHFYHLRNIKRPTQHSIWKNSQKNHQNEITNVSMFSEASNATTARFHFGTNGKRVIDDFHITWYQTLKCIFWGALAWFIMPLIKPIVLFLSHNSSHSNQKFTNHNLKYLWRQLIDNQVPWVESLPLVHKSMHDFANTAQFLHSRKCRFVLKPFPLLHG